MNYCFYGPEVGTGDRGLVGIDPNFAYEEPQKGLCGFAGAVRKHRVHVGGELRDIYALQQILGRLFQYKMSLKGGRVSNTR